jgi:adenylylsulfate kinase
MNDRQNVGATVWLTGLPSSGKTTVAFLVAQELAAHDVRVQVLDGDEMRTQLCADLGFSPADRRGNVRRIGFLAELLSRNGVITLVPVIAPYADSRAAVREHHRRHATPYLEAYIDTSTEVCAFRDVKGLYRRQRAGELSGLTGVDDPYEIPALPEVVITTSDRTPRQSAAVLVAELTGRGLLEASLAGTVAAH